MPLNLPQTLSELVRIPSVNPMGRAVQGDIYYEHRVTQFLEQFFTSHGIAWARQKVENQRENIIGRVDGEIPPEQGGPIVIFEAHQDTVPIDGMTIAPFGGEIKSGRVWGRGSCDIKGGMAAMLGALVRLKEERPKGRPTVIVACTVNEEHGFSGALAVSQSWTHPTMWPAATKLIPAKPKAVVIAEPTLLNVVVAHKGVARWRLHTIGKAGHSSRPEIADNATYRMAKVLNVLEKYAAEEVGKRCSYPLLGRPTLSVGIISGGVSVNTVPDRCTIEIDRRVLPIPEDAPALAKAHAEQFVRDHLGADFPLVHDEMFLTSPGLSDRLNHPLAEALIATAKSAGFDSKKIGVPFGTDAPPYDASGVPTVVFGPGSIDQAHTADEWLAIDQLEAASEILFRYASGA